jgi:epsilon-lactone hydrolase
LTNSAETRVQMAFRKCEELISSFAAVQNPGLYDGRRLFAIWVRQFPIPLGVSTSFVYPAGLPCMVVQPEGATPTRTILHIHGGAFASGNGSDFLAMGATIALAAQARVVLAEYRLAPEHPYPAGPDDCVSIYRGLLDLGVDPASLSVSGDSAGATLVLSTLIRARDAGLPLPCAAALLSPWIDLSMSCETYVTIKDPTATRESLQPYLAAYLQRRDPADPAVSPFFADLKGLPPTLIQVGSAEVFVGEATELAAKLTSVGVATTLDVAPGMPHIWHLFASFLPEARQAIERIAQFFSQHARQG